MLYQKGIWKPGQWIWMDFFLKALVKSFHWRFLTRPVVWSVWGRKGRGIGLVSQWEMIVTQPTSRVESGDRENCVTWGMFTKWDDWLSEGERGFYISGSPITANGGAPVWQIWHRLSSAFWQSLLVYSCLKMDGVRLLVIDVKELSSDDLQGRTFCGVRDWLDPFTSTCKNQSLPESKFCF